LCAKVGDELAEGDASARMFKQTRCCERAGADAAAFVGLDRRYGAIKIGKFCRPGLAIDLMLCQRKQTPTLMRGLFLMASCSAWVRVKRNRVSPLGAGAAADTCGSTEEAD